MWLKIIQFVGICKTVAHFDQKKCWIYSTNTNYALIATKKDYFSKNWAKKFKLFEHFYCFLG